MLTFELKKKLKKSGFIHKTPTLSNLIRACGNGFWGLERWKNKRWYAFGSTKKEGCHEVDCKGNSPEETIALLYLKLQKKNNASKEANRRRCQ